AKGVEQGLLHDIRGIDACGQAAVEVDGDHPLQAVAVLGEQLVPRRVIAACGALKRLVGLGSMPPRHRITPKMISPKRARLDTKKPSRVRMDEVKSRRTLGFYASAHCFSGRIW